MPAVDYYAGRQTPMTGPLPHCFAITPHDSNELTATTRGISANVAGAAVLVFYDDSEATFTMLAGVVYPFRVKQVKSTGTTATGLYGFY